MLDHTWRRGYRGTGNVMAHQLFKVYPLHTHWPSSHLQPIDTSLDMLGGDTTWPADEPLHYPYRGSHRRQLRSYIMYLNKRNIFRFNCRIRCFHTFVPDVPQTSLEKKMEVCQVLTNHEQALRTHLTLSVLYFVLVPSQKVQCVKWSAQSSVKKVRFLAIKTNDTHSNVIKIFLFLRKNLSSTSLNWAVYPDKTDRV